MTKEDRGWPVYLFGGRLRTSTLVLIVAFVLAWWLYQEYKPPPQPVQAPVTEVVPPGFVPDPNYTWVPRTNVQEPRTTTATTPTTPTTTETTTPTETTSPTQTTTSGSPTTSPTTMPAPPGAPPSTPASAVPGPGPSPSPLR